MKEVPANYVVEGLMKGQEDLSEYSVLELETAKMYLGLMESTVESELSQRYSKPIDVAEDEHTSKPVQEGPNWRPACTCSWLDRRLVPTETQANYAWTINHKH